MARVTVEDCLEKVSNRFALTVLASRRARALSEGKGQAQVQCDNKDAVTALREISAGHVRYTEDVEETIAGFIEEQRSQLRSSHGEHTFLEAASFGGGTEDDDEEDDVAELSGDLQALETDDDDDDDDNDGAPEGTTAEADDDDAPDVDGGDLDLGDEDSGDDDGDD